MIFKYVFLTDHSHVLVLSDLKSLAAKILTEIVAFNLHLKNTNLRKNALDRSVRRSTENYEIRKLFGLYNVIDSDLFMQFL